MNSSYYVHSHAANSLNTQALGLGADSNNSGGFQVYLSSAIGKLEAIKEELDNYAEEFLIGTTPETAQFEAKTVDDQLGAIALYIMNGIDMQKYAKLLTQNTLLDRDKLTKVLEKDGIDNKIKQVILSILEETEGNLPVSEVAKALTAKGGPVLVVSRSKSYFQRLGFLAGTDKFVFDNAEKDISSILTKRLSSRKGRLLQYTKAILKESDAAVIEDNSIAIERFFNEFADEFTRQARQKVHFVEGSKSPDEVIKDFLRDFRKNLEKNIGNNTTYQHSVGDIGEGVTAAITQSGNMTTVAIKTGDLTDKDLVKKIADQYEGDARLTLMRTHHDETKQSQTDLVLTNKNGMTVRAQSKNMSADRFLDLEITDDRVDNFRFKVQDSLSVGDFILNLANTDMGRALNANELESILAGLAQAVWMEQKTSTVGAGNGARGEKVSGEAMLEQFRHSLEAYASGQVTNLLGVTVQKDANLIEKNIVELTGSNIFFLQNGQLTKTSQLIDLAINQLKAYQEQGHAIDKTARAVIVTLDYSSIEWAEERAGWFYYEKLHYLTKEDEGGLIAYGEQQGQAAAQGIKVKATIGSSLLNFGNSSYVL